MKPTLAALLVALCIAGARGDDFFRKLPDPKFAAQLTQEKLRNVDAVMIVKDQALTINETEFTYKGIDFSGIAMTRTVAYMVKVFNEAGVREYGSFEFEYPERFGDDMRSGFAARARVQKPDGEVKVMPASDMRVIVSEESSDGEPLERKAMFKVPDLAPGDVVQIEYTLTEPLVRALSHIFFYNERIPVLFSNLMITLPADDEIKFFSFPPDRVGEPKVSQMSNAYGAGLTYGWTLKNLNAIPKEPRTYTFDDLSLMTAFVVNQKAENGYRRVVDWNYIGGKYFDDYVDAGSVKAKRIAELGFTGDRPPLSMAIADSLYTAIRHAIALKPSNSIYPLTGDIDEIFTRRRGDASDAAYIFFKVLKEWKADARAAWIRDKREGSYEQTVPSIHWFDRIGVLVKMGDEEKLYDFDRAAAAHYETPSYLRGIQLAVVGSKSCEHRTVPASRAAGSCVKEGHALAFSGTASLYDTLTYACDGTPAEEFRASVYELRGADLRERARKLAAGRCMADVDTTVVSAVLDDPEVAITCRGRAQGAVARVDAFLTAKMPNQSLRAFRDELFSAVRVNDLVLTEPLTFAVSWRLHLPAGYAVRSAPADTVLGGIPGMSASLHATREAGLLRMQAELKFTERVIPAESFPGVIRMIDALLASSEASVVLAKK